MAAWLAGNGCVPIYNLMEDAATAEISRAQLWQWVHQPNGVLSDGRKVTPELVRRLFEEQMGKLGKNVGNGAFRPRGNYRPGARKLIEGIVLKRRFYGIHDARGIRVFGLTEDLIEKIGSTAMKEHAMPQELEKSWETG